VNVRIEGFDLPGLSCAPRGAGRRYDNIHVGVQRRSEVVGLVPGDAPSAEWSFEVTTRPLRSTPDAMDSHAAGPRTTGPTGAAGAFVDFGGPFVHGRRGERFVYLSWGTVDGSDLFTMFRRAKLLLADVEPDLIRTAAGGSQTLVARLPRPDACGAPRCARVRPPLVTWTVDQLPRAVPGS
jgi:hypothetical protein